jgi:hypothetical protein
MAEIVSRAVGPAHRGGVSHVFVMDVPTYPKPLLITDAAINIAPTLEDKVHIIQNAIDLAHYHRLCRTEGRHSFGHGDHQPEDPVHARRCGTVQDGRSRPDHRGPPRWPACLRQRDFDWRRENQGHQVGRCRSCRHPRHAGSRSPATCSPSSWNIMANALTAAIVIGAKVPIVLTSRADTAETRMASCVIAALITHPTVEKYSRILMQRAILTINAGSSSVKFALYELDEHIARQSPFLSGQIDGIGAARANSLPRTTTGDAHRLKRRCPKAPSTPTHLRPCFHWFWKRIRRRAASIVAVGHRVVHGGELYSQPVRNRCAADRRRQLEQFIRARARCISRTTSTASRRSPKAPSRRAADRLLRHSLPSHAASAGAVVRHSARASTPQKASGATDSTAFPTNTSPASCRNSTARGRRPRHRLRTSATAPACAPMVNASQPDQLDGLLRPSTG